MNPSTPDDSQPAAGRPENAALRFLRWIIEPPVGPQSRESRVLRWLLRAVAFVAYAAIVGPNDGPQGGGGGGGHKEAKSGKRPA